MSKCEECKIEKCEVCGKEIVKLALRSDEEKEMIRSWREKWDKVERN